jgi:Protein of unknown function (DUF3800)
MFLMYVDESGDSGVPGVSPIFVLTGLVLHEPRWRTFSVTMSRDAISGQIVQLGTSYALSGVLFF